MLRAICGAGVPTGGGGPGGFGGGGGGRVVRGNIFTEMSAASVENLYRMYADPSYRNICAFVCLHMSTIRLGQDQFFDRESYRPVQSLKVEIDMYFLCIGAYCLSLETMNILRYMIFMNRHAAPYSYSQMYLTKYSLRFWRPPPPMFKLGSVYMWYPPV